MVNPGLTFFPIHREKRIFPENTKIPSEAERGYIYFFPFTFPSRKKKHSLSKKKGPESALLLALKAVNGIFPPAAVILSL
jgi:hypothetical protein